MIILTFGIILEKYWHEKDYRDKYREIRIHRSSFVCDIVSADQFALKNFLKFPPKIS